MIHSSSIFSTYSPWPSSRKLATTDDSLTIVAGGGNVIHVPRLSTNFVFVQKLTQDLHLQSNLSL